MVRGRRVSTVGTVLSSLSTVYAALFTGLSTVLVAFSRGLWPYDRVCVDGVFRSVSFTRDGVPEYGEFVECPDGSAFARVSGVDGESVDVLVRGGDGLMPVGIGDVLVSDVPVSVMGDGEYEPDPASVERLSKTNLILEEWSAGVLDDSEAGAALFDQG